MAGIAVSACDSSICIVCKSHTAVMVMISWGSSLVLCWWFRHTACCWNTSACAAWHADGSAVFTVSRLLPSSAATIMWSALCTGDCFLTAGCTDPVQQSWVMDSSSTPSLHCQIHKLLATCLIATAKQCMVWLSASSLVWNHMPTCWR